MDGDIAVGKDPEVIAVNQKTNTIYVVNSIDGTVSSIKLPAMFKGA